MDVDVQLQALILRYHRAHRDHDADVSLPSWTKQKQPGDGLLKAYQRPPAMPPAETLEQYGSRVRAALSAA